MMYKYNNWIAIARHKNIYTSTTFIDGRKLQALIKADQVEATLQGLRSTGWKEEHNQSGDSEYWKFTL